MFKPLRELFCRIPKQTCWGFARHPEAWQIHPPRPQNAQLYTKELDLSHNI